VSRALETTTAAAETSPACCMKGTAMSVKTVLVHLFAGRTIAEGKKNVVKNRIKNYQRVDTKRIT